MQIWQVRDRIPLVESHAGLGNSYAYSGKAVDNQVHILHEKTTNCFMLRLASVFDTFATAASQGLIFLFLTTSLTLRLFYGKTID